ncbi:hypothetical protein BDZ97DRAFT_1922304 [Flammula alnicola]|nr:hypothetical protein BDZ97DRAFT_1922304 [Flammula alnicola]
MQAVAIPVLPQEVINLIIDEIASEWTSDGNLSSALQACSLVSRAFHSQSQRHLFSHIEFEVDDLAQTRAVQLISILEHPDGENLLSIIRSIAVFVDTRSSKPLTEKASDVTRAAPLNLYERSRDAVLDAPENSGLQQNHVLRLLEIVTRINIEKFMRTCETQPNGRLSLDDGPWLDLDQALTNRAFVSLRRVDLDIKLFHTDKDFNPGELEAEESGLDIRSFLPPCVHTSPSIKIDVNVEPILDLYRLLWF